MKKFWAVLSFVVISLATLFAYPVSSHTTLSNDQYNQKLFLYTNGRCAVTIDDGRGGSGDGSYDLKINGEIHIQWDNGVKQQGTFVKDQYGIKSVSIKGITYTVGRRVVPRPRR